MRTSVKSMMRKVARAAGAALLAGVIVSSWGCKAYEDHVRRTDAIGPASCYQTKALRDLARFNRSCSPAAIYGSGVYEDL